LILATVKPAIAARTPPIAHISPAWSGGVVRQNAIPANPAQSAQNNAADANRPIPWGSWSKGDDGR
jgi:hypothetical protein